MGDDLYRAMRPALAVGNGALWLISTPNDPSGFFCEEWTHGGPEWERILMTAPECQRIDADFLAKEKEREGDKWFRQEYLCEFMQKEGAIFSREAIEDALAEEYEGLEL